MSRSFNGTTDKILTSTSPITTGIRTLACWFQVGTTAGDGVPFGITKSDISQYTLIYFKHTTQKLGGNCHGNAAFFSGATISTNTWYHAALTVNATTSATIYVNGGSAFPSGSLSGAVYGGETTVCIGAHNTGAFLPGLVAECAVWNAILTVAELAQLAKAYSPQFIRPENLIYYAPLIGRTSPEIDVVGGRGGTLTGTSAAAHPRIINFKRKDAA